ncbi:leucine-rich repeat domain-containing protein [Rhabdochromatium marinum]|uniref:leucine-rich repeat domain-containing protein n=1 Tax=Rhabdochromatium marinum TaxID=48729 RepID=UPI0019076D7E|nr:leucine-rich repeat domain-containing protein [Rhabdochromatium marinum]
MTLGRKYSEMGLDIARERIAQESIERTGHLDLGNLGLNRLPPELWELDLLETLCLGGVLEYISTFRRSKVGSWYVTDEPHEPNQLEGSLAPIARLPKLRNLDCSGALITNLQPLAALVNLQQLDLTSTQVSDLQPLAALVNLQQLDLRFTQVSDLQPLAALVNLQQLDLTSTQVSDLQPLAALVNLQQLDLTASTQVSDFQPLAALVNLQQLDLS